jgi:integrase/recombinase XerD
MTENDARRHLAVVRFDPGGNSFTRGLRVHPLVEEWALWQRSGRRSERTIEERSRVIGQFLSESGVDPVTAGPMDVARWMASKPGWGPSTAATYYSYLTSWHKWLLMMGHRSDNPMAKLQTPRRPERSPRPVADDDLVRVLRTRMHHRTRVMLLLAALAGLRVSEIARVCGEHIDRAAGRIHVVGKGGKAAWIPLHPLLLEVADTMPRRGYWFPGNCRRPGLPVRSKSVSDILTGVMRRAGVRDTPHALRHWYASTLLDDGADLRTVQELMRHSSIQTTQVYTKVKDIRRIEAVGRLDPFRAA